MVSRAALQPQRLPFSSHIYLLALFLALRHMVRCLIQGGLPRPTRRHFEELAVEGARQGFVTERDVRPEQRPADH